VPVSGPTVPRAPTRDGAATAVPPLAAVGAVLAENRRRLSARAGLTVLGRPWAEVREEARREALAAARAYLVTRGEPASALDPSRPLVAAGHQPELFHPGVWVKNFALQGLARAHGLTPLNLIVDSDTAKACALRLPAPPDAEHPWPHAVTVPYDRWAGETPYEEQRVREPALFESFGERAGKVLRSWGYGPILPAFWEEVVAQARRTPNPGECFAAARRAWERRWGCSNLEVPLSALCRTESFAWFACQILGDLPWFHSLYNACLREHRRLHGIRSRNHPVPDLGAGGGWLETPFRAWREGRGRRQRLFARTAGKRLELRAGQEIWPSLPHPAAAPKPATAAWLGLQQAGYKLRSRALTTTLFARLFLSDLFLHGIGGGTYDELTDELARKFYRGEPPAFVILSATRLLPLPLYPQTEDDCRRLARRARDLHWNPQRHLDGAEAGELRGLAEERERWAGRTPADRAGRRERFARLRELTEKLRRPLEGRERELREELGRCERAVEANALLRRRDWAFCLYPEEPLRELCTRFLDPGAAG
jgi:hypothetical protein